MKHLFFIAALFLSFTVFGQLNHNTPTGAYIISNSDNSIKMQVKQKEIKIDQAWQVAKYNLDPLSDYLSKEISNAQMLKDSIRANKLISLKRKIWNSLRDFRNMSVDTIVNVITIDSLQTRQKIADNTKEITRLKMLKLNCVECDTVQIGKKIFELKNEKNKLVNYTKIWTKIQ